MAKCVEVHLKPTNANFLLLYLRPTWVVFFSTQTLEHNSI